jgi:photosystem II PsbY protein
MREMMTDGIFAASCGARVFSQTAAMGMAATLFFADHADAAQELMQSADAQNVADLAGIDGRIAISFVFAPVLGWVAYNILGPGLRQLEDMQKANAKRKGVLAGAGLSAAALMGMPEASEAAQNVGDLAGIDGRIAIFFVFAPVLGWVAYNILGPGLRQLEDMQKANAKRK